MKFKKVSIIISCVLVASVCTCVGLGLNKNNDKQTLFVTGIIPERTETEMYLDSDVILEGTVEKLLDSKWSNPNFHRGDDISNVLQTDVIVNVDKVYGGNLLKDTVVVRIDKGEDDNTIVYSEGYPDFEVGENVLLFLSRDDSDVATNEDYYVLTGMKYGKYTLSNTTNTGMVRESRVYSNEKGQVNPQKIEATLKEMKEKNPNYKELKQKKMEETIKKNKELFGE